MSNLPPKKCLMGHKDTAPILDDDLGITLDALLTAWVTERGSNEKTIQAVRSAFEEFKSMRSTNDVYPVTL